MAFCLHAFTTSTFSLFYSQVFFIIIFFDTSVSTDLCAHFREITIFQVLLKNLLEDPKFYICLENENRVIFAQSRI